MIAILFTVLAYLVFPLATLYSCFAAIYLFDVRDPEFLRYLVLWLPGIFLYYIYIGQLIIGQRLPFLDRIWGFPNLVRKHQGLFRKALLLTLVLHSVVHLYTDGIDKVLLHPDLGVIVGLAVVAASIALMAIALKIWLKPKTNAAGQTQKVASYAKMHRLHQLFYLLAIGAWYHVITSAAFADNYLGLALVTGYLLFALSCKLYLLLAQHTAPVYTLARIEKLHPNFVRLTLRVPRRGNARQQRRIRALSGHQGGQYAYFSFVLPGKGVEQHPFSFAGYAGSHSDESVLSIVVKKLGDFTARLPDLAVGTKVKVQGPYGKFVFCKQGFQGLHLIAAGIGITPFLSMLEQRAYAAGQSMPQNTMRTLTLHWFVSQESELVFADRFGYFLQQLPNIRIRTYVGQPITESLLNEILSLPASAAKESYRRLGIAYCGPSVVLPAIQQTMGKLGIPRANFHTELFSFSAK